MTGVRSPIRVLIVDDSGFSRKTIARILASSPLIEVIGTAVDGEEALKKALLLKPDLITLDLEMPRMDGFTFLRLVMSQSRTAVIVISSRGGEQDVFKALELGAVDFVAKPAARPGAELEGIAQELLAKAHAVRQFRIDKVAARGFTKSSERKQCSDFPALPSHHRVVVIGSSTGGPSALLQVFSGFSDALPCAVIVAQHMAEGFTDGFAARLDRLTPFRAREARGGEILDGGQLWIAPGGSHLELENVDGRIMTKIVAQVRGDRCAPSVDRLLISAAKHFGEGTLGVILTGMGDDGRVGAMAIKEVGGTVIAESEETAVIFGMPQMAIRSGAVDSILPLDKIGMAIQRGVSNANGSKDR